MKELFFFWRNFVTFWTQTEPYRPGETISPLVMGVRKQKIVTSCSQYKLRFPPQLIWSRQSLMNICFHDYSKTHQAGIKMFWENLMLFGTKRYQRATLQTPKDRDLGEESMDPSTPEATMVAEGRLFEKPPLESYILRIDRRRSPWRSQRTL